LSKYKIIFDLEFVDIMKEREMKSLVLQLSYCYGLNRYLKNPFNLNLFSFNNSVKFETEKMGGKFWHVNFNEENFYENEEIISNKDNLIYLSPDSPNILKDINQENIFIIGGFVDKPISKNRTLFKANSLGIKTAKLPIDDYMDDLRSSVLNVNTVVEILGNFIESKNWDFSIKKAIPKRMNFNRKIDN
jgi:tRNA (guanine9-N1)-methyltransferase